MLRRFWPAADSCGVEVSSRRQRTRALAIGKLGAVTGVVAIKRADTIAQVAVGDSVYLGDVIETGPDGSVAVSFADGTGFHLRPGTVMVLDKFDSPKKKKRSAKPSALFRILKGMFVVFAGKLS